MGCRTDNRTEGTMGKPPALTPALALLALAGCATHAEVDRLRSDIAGLRAAVEAGNAAHTSTAEAAAPEVAAEPPPAGYEPASRFGLPDFMPGLGALYVRPGSMPAGPFLAYDRDDRLVS